MKLGDVITNAIWVTGEEPESLLNRYKKDVVDSLDTLCQQEGFYRGNIVFIEKIPGWNSVPPGKR